MKTSLYFIGLALVGAATLGIGAPGRADTVELKDGGAIQGIYLGGTATTISLDTAQGVLAVPTAQVSALKFSAAPVAPPPAPPIATPAATPGPVTIPAGTVLVVRMDRQIASTDRAGTKFTAKLVGDLMAGDVAVAKAGTTVHGQVEQSKKAGRLAGKSQLAISLTGFERAGNVLPIMTTNFAEVGKGEFRKTARNVAGGALIGNAIDSSGGGGAGAAVGAGVSLIKKGDAVTIPPGALLEFRLTQPVTVPAS